MSDTEKKKGGKLPIIAALVLVLGAGGFFGLKGGGGEAKEEEPEIKMGDNAPIGEFLVNLADGRTYLRAAVALHFDATFDAKHLDSDMPVIQDAILMVLSSKSLEDVRSLDGKQKLKWEIAAKVNHSLHAGHDTKKKKKKKEEDAEAETHGDHKVTPPENEEGWDADEGPVLKVYFTSFVTQ